MDDLLGSPPSSPLSTHQHHQQMLMSYDDVCIDLQILAKLEVTQKIQVLTGRIQISTYHWLVSPFMRYASGESREKTITHLQTLLLRRVPDLIQEYINTDPGRAQKLIKLLASAQIGVLRLRNTYREDINTASRFEHILSELELIMNAIGIRRRGDSPS